MALATRIRRPELIQHSRWMWGKEGRDGIFVPLLRFNFSLSLSFSLTSPQFSKHNLYIPRQGWRRSRPVRVRTCRLLCSRSCRTWPRRTQVSSRRNSAQDLNN